MLSLAFPTGSINGVSETGNAGNRIAAPRMARLCGVADSRFLQWDRVHSLIGRLASLHTQSLQINASAVRSKDSVDALHQGRHTAPEDYAFVNNATAALNNGENMPLVGIGTWRGEAQTLQHAVETALRTGYRCCCRSAASGWKS